MTNEIPNGMRIHHEVQQLAESMLLSEAYFQFPGTTVIVCLLTTHHGHHEIGSSYFLDPEEFDDEQGRASARADAMKYLYQVAHYLHREKQFNDGAVLEPAVPIPDIQNVGMGYSITRVPIVDNRIPPLGVKRPLKDMTVSELRVAYIEATEALHAYTKMVIEKPAIQWLDTGSSLGPVPLKGEGKRATDDPLEDRLRIAALQAHVDSIALEVKRRHESFYGEPPIMAVSDELKQAPTMEPGGVTFVETGPDLDAVEDAMKEATVADIAEVITRMHAAMVANREAAMRKYEELGQEADAQLAAEIEQTKGQTEGAGVEQISEATRALHKGDLITADEMTRLQEDVAHLSSSPTFTHRERDSQVSGDGVEKAEGSE